jgi:hypothetical protein
VAEDDLLVRRVGYPGIAGYPGYVTFVVGDCSA